MTIDNGRGTDIIAKSLANGTANLLFSADSPKVLRRFRNQQQHGSDDWNSRPDHEIDDGKHRHTNSRHPEAAARDKKRPSARKEAVIPASAPRVVDDCPIELAMVGRSNVGKSSLVNALLRRSGLARVSRQPGRTDRCLFFGIELSRTQAGAPKHAQRSAQHERPQSPNHGGDHKSNAAKHPAQEAASSPQPQAMPHSGRKGIAPTSLTVVDLPGYGFAARTKTERRHWEQLVTAYMGDNHPRGVLCWLLDTRRLFERWQKAQTNGLADKKWHPNAGWELLPDTDLQCAEVLSAYGFPIVVVGTKMDAMPKTMHQQMIAIVQQRLAQLPGFCPPPVFVSARSGAGIEGLRHAIAHAFDSLLLDTEVMQGTSLEEEEATHGNARRPTTRIANPASDELSPRGANAPQHPASATSSASSSSR